MLCFVENIWLRYMYVDYISKMALKSSNTKNAALQMQFLILNWRTNYCKCDSTLFYSRRTHAFVYLLDGIDFIDVFP